METITLPPRGTRGRTRTGPPPAERIRPELNLEKWSVWQPAKSTQKPRTRVLEREVTLADGTRATARVEVGFTQRGSLTTEDQKTYYALVKVWEDGGRPAEFTAFSLRQLARILKKNGWGTNVIEALTHSLTRLRITPFIWEQSYYDKSAGETVDLLEPFNILADLKVVRRRRDGVVNSAVGYFRFNDFVLRNLLANHTKPLLLETVLAFRSEVAQLLYTRLDYLLYRSPAYERCSKELFDDLGLEGAGYRNPSNRKQVLERALKELQGAPITSGVIAAATLVRTKDGADYKAVFRRAAHAQVKVTERVEEQGGGERRALPPPPPPPDPQRSEAEQLVRHFYQLFHGSGETVHPTSKALDQAQSLVARLGSDAARHVVEFAREAAKETDFRPQTFGGILQYEARAMAGYQQAKDEEIRREARRQAAVDRKGAIFTTLREMLARMESEHPAAFAAFQQHLEAERDAQLRRYPKGQAQESFRRYYASERTRLGRFQAYFRQQPCPIAAFARWLKEHPEKELSPLFK